MAARWPPFLLARSSGGLLGWTQFGVGLMNTDYHALLPINGKKFSGGHLTAVVVNIPGPTQDSNNVLYLTRFEGTPARRMLNLWVAEETLRLIPNAHRD